MHLFKWIFCRFLVEISMVQEDSLSILAMGPILGLQETLVTVDEDRTSPEAFMEIPL